MNLELLQPDLFCNHIVPELGIRDVLNLARVSSALKKLVDQEATWKNLLHTRFVFSEYCLKSIEPFVQSKGNLKNFISYQLLLRSNFISGKCTLRSLARSYVGHSSEIEMTCGIDPHSETHHAIFVAKQIIDRGLWTSNDRCLGTDFFDFQSECKSKRYHVPYAVSNLQAAIGFRSFRDLDSKQSHFSACNMQHNTTEYKITTKLFSDFLVDCNPYNPNPTFITYEIAAEYYLKVPKPKPHMQVTLRTVKDGTILEQFTLETAVVIPCFAYPFIVPILVTQTETEITRNAQIMNVTTREVAGEFPVLLSDKFKTDGVYLVTMSSKGKGATIFLRSLRSGKLIRDGFEISENVDDFTWTLTVLITVHEGGYLQIFDLQTGNLLNVLKPFSPPIKHIYFRDGKIITHSAQELLVWNFSPKPLQPKRIHVARISCTQQGKDSLETLLADDLFAHIAIQLKCHPLHIMCRKIQSSKSEKILIFFSQLKVQANKGWFHKATSAYNSRLNSHINNYIKNEDSGSSESVSSLNFNSVTQPVNATANLIKTAQKAFFDDDEEILTSFAQGLEVKTILSNPSYDSSYHQAPQKWVIHGDAYVVKEILTNQGWVFSDISLQEIESLKKKN